jgi:hypothetical protein
MSLIDSLVKFPRKVMLYRQAMAGGGGSRIEI